MHSVFSFPGRLNQGRIVSIITGALLISAALAPAQTFTFGTLAGSIGQGSVNSMGTNASFRQPGGVAIDGSGNIYVSDSGNNTIRKITSAGVVSTLAGSPGVAGNANGTNALFSQPAGLAVDAGGNVYVADYGNNLIRKITSAGVVSTYGASASFSHPMGVAVDSSTNVYVADYGNHAIRKIAANNGAVTTFAGTLGTSGTNDGAAASALFYQPQGVAVDSTGANVFVADTANNTIRKIVAGIVTTIAGSSTNFGSSNAVAGTNALFYQPAAIAVDASLNLYVADYINNTIRKITAAGVVTTLAGSAGAFGSTDGSTTNALFWGPAGVAVDGSGSVYVADSFNNEVRRVTSSGVVSTFAGSSSIGSFDGQGTKARFNNPLGGAVDALGNIYLPDSANHTIRKISRTGLVSTFAGSPGKAGSADGSGTNALFNGPQAVAVDFFTTNIYVADTLNNTIRKITAAGSVTTLAGTAGVANNYDGTNTTAAFNHPAGISVDFGGSVYVADTGNSTIRKINKQGIVTTLAGLAGNTGTLDSTNKQARFNGPKGLSVDATTNIFVADTLNHTIREVSQSGTNWVVTTIAGLANVYGTNDGFGTSTNAAFFYLPEALVVDLAENIYVADSGNHTIRELVSTGTNWSVTTTAGLPTVSGSSDGSGTGVQFFNPGGLALDNFGYLYVMDTENNTIRTDSTIVLPLVIEDVFVVARPTSATVTWLSSLAANAQIQYGTTTSYGISFINTNLQTSQGMLLTGLTPNTQYYFQVTSANSNSTYSVAGSFYTSTNIIMQSSDAQYTGVWVNDTSGPDRYSSIYKFASTTNADTADAVFRPTFYTPGQYDVSIWYSEGTNRSALAPATVSFLNGSISTFVNETLPGGQWVSLITNQTFDFGTNAFVRLGNFTGESNRIVIADAIQWAYNTSQDFPTANGTLPIWYTSFYFGTTNVNSATLGTNGQSLLNDFILGISPTDPNATLSFKLFPSAGSGFQAVFSPWQYGRNYQVYSTTNLSHPTWSPVTGLNLAVTNNIGYLTSTNAVTAAATFYRLGVQYTQ